MIVLKSKISGHYLKRPGVWRSHTEGATFPAAFTWMHEQTWPACVRRPVEPA